MTFHVKIRIMHWILLPLYWLAVYKGKLLHMEVSLNFDCLTFSTKNKSRADFMTCIGCCQSEGSHPPAFSSATWVNSLRGSDLTHSTLPATWHVHVPIKVQESMLEFHFAGHLLLSLWGVCLYTLHNCSCARELVPSCPAIAGDPAKNAAAPIAIHFTTSAWICSRCHTCTNVFYTESKYKSELLSAWNTWQLWSVIFSLTFYNFDPAVFCLYVIQFLECSWCREQ